MNKQNINKIKLFLMGLQNRFSENKSIFKSIHINFKDGLKEFKGIGTYEEGNIKYNFSGKTQMLSISSLFNELCEDLSKYDSVNISYIERGSHILITGDNKNVKMTNKEVNEEESLNNNNSSEGNLGHINETSTLLNRDYYIKVGKADDLLKEIGIMTKDGKIKNDKIRKYNQIDRYVELLEGILDTLPEDNTINILDCGCGKSYLTFVLNYYLTEVKKRKCFFIGLDYSKGVIESSKTMADHLGYRNMKFIASDIKDYVPDRKINVVISLHACDTATDMALAFGIRVKSDVIIAVPCCHRELLNQYSYEPFKHILKYGLLKSRMADVLTDGMRSMFLEAKGYDVSVVEYISPLETPKNLMIRALKTGNERQNIMEDYENLMKSLGAEPALFKMTNESWLSD